MLAEHPSGTLFLSGYPSQVSGRDPNAKPQLWKSTDRGLSWNRVDVGSSVDAAGNSDVDLAVSEKGTLYFVVMGFDRETGEGTHIAIGTSRDVGLTWSWSRLSETRLDDRPWVEVAPDGTAHVVWNDGAGVAHALSRDEGASWQEQARIHDQGGSSHLAVGPAGEIAVRITPLAASGNRFTAGVEHLGVSLDGGESWTLRPVPGVRDWDPTFRDPSKVPRWVEPVAWDREGTLFLLYTEAAEDGGRVMLARSRDRGVRWETATVRDVSGLAFFPYLVARGDGELAASWFEQYSSTDLRARVAHLVVGPAILELEVYASESFPIDAWNEPSGGATEGERLPTTGGEYLPVAFLADGDLAVAAPIQDAAMNRWGFSYWSARLPGQEGGS